MLWGLQSRRPTLVQRNKSCHDQRFYMWDRNFKVKYFKLMEMYVYDNFPLRFTLEDRKL